MERRAGSLLVAVAAAATLALVTVADPALFDSATLATGDAADFVASPSDLAGHTRLFLDPRGTVSLTVVELDADGVPQASTPLDAAVTARARDGGAIGFLARPLGDGEGRGFAGEGHTVRGTVTAPSARGFTFHAHAESRVYVHFEGAAFEAIQVLSLTRDSHTFPMTGLGRDHVVPLGADAVEVTLVHGGSAGALTLTDPHGAERARVASPGEDALVLADAPGEWRVACDGTCVGDARVHVARIPT